LNEFRGKSGKLKTENRKLGGNFELSRIRDVHGIN